MAGIWRRKFPCFSRETSLFTGKLEAVRYLLHQGGGGKRKQKGVFIQDKKEENLSRQYFKP